jgi:hypothetical protein
VSCNYGNYRTDFEVARREGTLLLCMHAPFEEIHSSHSACLEEFDLLLLWHGEVKVVKPLRIYIANQLVVVWIPIKEVAVQDVSAMSSIKASG